MVATMQLLALLIAHIACSFASPYPLGFQDNCSSVQEGFHCDKALTRNWGPYSPFFAVAHKPKPTVPATCEVTFAQVLSRHGARYPTSGAGRGMEVTMKLLRKKATTFPGKYAFLKKYKYKLGKDSLTAFGQKEMYDSGVAFYERYKKLAEHEDPFCRSSSSKRVVMSGMNFTQGFLQAKTSSTKPPLPMVVLCQKFGFNCTLSVSGHRCPTFLIGQARVYKTSKKFAMSFTAPIAARLNTDLGTSLGMPEVIAVMSMCPFETVATADGTLSPFCNLFTDAEWSQYNVYQSMLKYGGFGAGASLGPTQGVGWVNELIARLTNKPVVDETCTNSTLDRDPKTFPLGRKLYADFSHDSQMTSILFAMNLFPAIVPGSGEGAYNAATSVPFAARIYVEKLRCSDSKEEMVRVLVNDKVIPLKNCGANKHGMCTLSNFVKSMSFARSMGKWSDCYNTKKYLRKWRTDEDSLM